MKLNDIELGRIAYSFLDKRTFFELSCPGNVTAEIEELKDKQLTADIKEKKKKRSLDANAYFHVLVQGLANKFGTTLEEMKVIENLKYGTVAKNKDGTKIGIKVPYGTDISEYFPYVKKFGECEENGMTWEKYLVYKETHTLDTKEMATLISGVVEDCKENGIDTLEDIEIKKMFGGGA